MASAPDTRSQRKSNHHHASHRHTRQGSAKDSKHLDFNQAMEDFKAMFPTMDSEIIEAVLRANNGAVDATIDQLLTMNVDFNEADSGVNTVPYPSPAAPPVPPPYQSPEGSSSDDDDDGLPGYTEALRSMKIREQTVPKQTYALEGHRLASINNPLTQSRRAYRRWNPPLLGKLPDDFLRLVPTRQSNSIPSRNNRHRTLGDTKMQQSFSNGTPSSEKREKSHHKRTPSNEISSQLLQQRMAENEKQRQGTPKNFDPEMARYLEDERLALILQNQMFLDELRRNEEFMNALEKDVKNEYDIAQERQGIQNKDTPKENSSGYGDDSLGELGAFPHTKDTDPQANDAEFKAQLKNMGTSSKTKFALLAKKFFSRRKRSKKPYGRQMLKDSSAPSTINLLDDHDDEDVEDEQEKQRQRQMHEKPVIEPLPGALAAVPSHKTVQKPPLHPEPIVFYQDDDNFHDMV